MLKLNTLSGFGSGAVAGGGGTVGTAGWSMGGATSGDSVGSTTAQKMVFATDTTSTIAGAVLDNKFEAPMGSCGDTSTAGWSMGGWDNSTRMTMAQKTTFSSETTAAVGGAVLDNGSSHGHGGSEGTLYGYVFGGWTGGYHDDIVKLTYSSETTAAIAGVLTKPLQSPAMLSYYQVAGYAMGGSDGVRITTARKINYSNDAVSTVAGAALTTAIFHAGTHSSDSAGYHSGGWTGGGAYVADTDKMVYITETTSALTGGDLSTGAKANAGIGSCSNSTGKGYWVGGVSPRTDEVEVMDYSSETYSSPAGLDLESAISESSVFSDGWV